MKIEIFCLLVLEELRQILQSDLVSAHKVQLLWVKPSPFRRVIFNKAIKLWDSYTYVEILKWCFKQRHLVAAKQVQHHIKSRMQHNMWVANNLLSVYIRCGRLQDAHRAFNELVQKNVYSWTIVIRGLCSVQSLLKMQWKSSTKCAKKGHSQMKSFEHPTGMCEPISSRTGQWSSWTYQIWRAWLRCVRRNSSP